MGLSYLECIDLASAEETPELNLAVRAAGLSDDRRRRCRDDTKL